MGDSLRHRRTPARATVLGTLLVALVAGPRADATDAARGDAPAGMIPAAAAEGWPRFRGPGGAGRADGPVPLRWSDEENVVWRTAIPGRGWSSPVVLEGRIWVTSGLEEERSLRAIALGLESGEILHEVEVFRPETWQEGYPTNTQASPTAVLAPGRVWVHFGPYGTAALDAATGEVLWRNREIRPRYEVGAGSSPILWEDRLIVPFDGTDLQEIVAFDAATGEIVWRADRGLPSRFKPPHRKAFSTPIVVDAGRRLELIAPGAQQVVAYDPSNGRRWWSVDYDGYSIVPGPVAGGGLVFVSTGFMQAELFAIRPGGVGDVTESRIAWRTRWHVPRNTTPLVVGDRLFMVSDNGRGSWLDLETGEEKWLERLGGNHSASPIVAGDRIYAFAEDGSTIVVAADDTFEILAENRIDAEVKATPAAVGGRLVIRTAEEVLCIEEPAP